MQTGFPSVLSQKESRMERYQSMLPALLGMIRHRAKSVKRDREEFIEDTLAQCFALYIHLSERCDPRLIYPVPLVLLALKMRHS